MSIFKRRTVKFSDLRCLGINVPKEEKAKKKLETNKDFSLSYSGSTLNLFNYKFLDSRFQIL